MPVLFLYVTRFSIPTPPCCIIHYKVWSGECSIPLLSCIIHGTFLSVEYSRNPYCIIHIRDWSTEYSTLVILYMAKSAQELYYTSATFLSVEYNIYPCCIMHWSTKYNKPVAAEYSTPCCIIHFEVWSAIYSTLIELYYTCHILFSRIQYPSCIIQCIPYSRQQITVNFLYYTF